MKIIVITQEDAFVIPSNIQLLLKIEGIQISKIIVVDAPGSLTNKKTFFLKGFGLRQSLRMASVLLLHRSADYVDSLLAYRAFRQKHSIEAVARANSIPFVVVPSQNKASLLHEVSHTEPDLVVSFSAPVVFAPELLAVPKHGCINLHCSLLPKYAGLMPSFWTLYHKETFTGVTVHYMDDKIDNGMILAQEKVEIEPQMTMFELIHRTKQRGGELMVRVIRQIQQNQTQPIPNPSQHGSYFSWPKIQQLKEFRKRGGRLI